MTDRHIHCVYYQYDTEPDIEGYCLLKKKKIDHFYGNCCENIELTPRETIIRFMQHTTGTDWYKACEIADEYFKEIFPNNCSKKENKELKK